jgi:hypothetical protein
LSVIHPISRLRLESHVAVIRLMELPSQFRVISADLVSIEILPDNLRQQIRDIILSFQTNHPNEVSCVAMFDMEAIDDSSHSFIGGYRFGPYSNLAAIQEKAAAENDRQADLIKMLNKEN